jgi:hypothetical protein
MEKHYTLIVLGIMDRTLHQAGIKLAAAYGPKMAGMPVVAWLLLAG